MDSGGYLMTEVVEEMQLNRNRQNWLCLVNVKGQKNGVVDSDKSSSEIHDAKGYLIFSIMCMSATMSEM